MKLYEHQERALDFLATNNKSLLCMDLGLGKTATAINSIEPNEKTLVITPATLKYNWAKEFQMWRPEIKVQVINGGRDSILESAQVHIINFDVLGKRKLKPKKHIEYNYNLDNHDYDKVIIDESSYIKNINAIRSLICGKICFQARKVILLSGTPMDLPKHLFVQLRCINALSMQYFDFTKKFCAGYYEKKFGRKIWNDTGSSNEGELKKILHKKMLRMKKEDVLDLPEKIIVAVDLDLKDAPHDIEDGRISIDPDGVPEVPMKKLSKYLHEIGLKKTKSAISHIKMRLEETNKIFVVARHIGVIRELEEAFPNSLTISGDVKLEERQKRIDRFQNDSSIPIFIGQFEAVKTGITLTAANHVVIVEPSWSYSDTMQVIDRCILEGQEVLTPSGFKLIQNITVGDKVINRHGDVVDVTDVWSRGNTKDIIEIEVFGYNKKIKVTYDHMMLVGGSWVEAGQLKPGDCLDTPLKTEKNKSNEKFTNDQLFTFGYYIGDGFCRKKGNYGGFKRFISLSGHVSKKKTSLDRCEKYFKSLGLKKHSVTKCNNREDRYYCNHISSFFTENFGRVCELKKIPEWVFHLSEKQLSHFLDGLSASDGYLRKGRVEYVSISKSLCLQICRLVMLLGKKPCISQQTKGHWVVAYNKKADKNKRVGQVRSVLRRKCKKVNDTRERVFDITVSEGSSFCVGFFVAHNCHRIGQNRCVTAELLTIKDSLDAIMINHTLKKRNNINRLIEK